MDVFDYDIVIVGAGVSGINAAYRLQTECPELTYTILEGRADLGGTWDLFKFPGVRADTDLYTYAFEWRPWTRPETVGLAHVIRDYLRDSASEQGIDKHITFQQKVTFANWSSKTQGWTLQVQDGKTGGSREVRCRFVFFATGYFDYVNPATVEIPGLDSFQGQVIHPQFWPEGTDLKGKNVVIVGSGATAITLVPSIGKEAKEVTMLQRSPCYIISTPSQDPIEALLRWILPVTWAVTLIRWKWLFVSQLTYDLCKAFPTASRWTLQSLTRRQLPSGPQFAIDPHFTPRYNPWDQRPGLCPDGEFFQGIARGNAKVVTDTIETVTKDSIVLRESKQPLHPDIIITATGHRLCAGGGIGVSLDGVKVSLARRYLWHSTLIEGIPNAALCLAHVNASWTLGANCAATLFVRIVKYMREKQFKSVVPTLPVGEDLGERPVVDLDSSYVIKAKDYFPRTGTKGPWKPRSTYYRDIRFAKRGDITEDLVYD